MKKKILIILIVLIGLSLGGFFVYRNIFVPEQEAEETPLIVEEKPVAEEELEKEEVPKETEEATTPSKEEEEKVSEEKGKESEVEPIEDTTPTESETETPIMISDTTRTGEINSDEIWSGTIHVTGDIMVREGITLTILPGTVVEVAAFSDDQHSGVDDYTPNPWFPKDPARIGTKSTSIMIMGTLNASGTPDNKIIFTSDSNNPTTYDWDGLGISHGKLEYSIVEYARYTNFQESSDVIVANNIFRHILECCICIGHSKSISPQILNNEAYNCGHEVIDYAGGSSLIKGNYFHLGDRSLQPDPNRGGVGIVVYQNAYPVIEQNVLKDHSVGVYFNEDLLNEEEEGKKVILRNNRMENNRVNTDIDSGYPAKAIVMENNHANVVIEGGYPAKAIVTEKNITGYIRDCSFRVGENVPVSAKITYDNTVVSTSDDGYFSITVEGDPELLIAAEGYHDYTETPSRMVNNAFYLIPDDVYQDLYSVVWEEQIYNPNNWMRKWTRQPEIIIAKEEGSNGQVDTVVSALSGDVFNKMTGGLYSSENITILDELPEELYETKNRDGKIIIYFANEMIDGGVVAIGGSAHSTDDGDGNISFGELTWKPSDNFNKYNVFHELVHAITTGGHINYKASIVSEVYSTPNSEPTEADYKFLNCIYNSPLKRAN